MRTKSIEAKDVKIGDCLYMKKALRDYPGMFIVEGISQNVQNGPIRIKLKGSGQHLSVLPCHTFWLRLPEGIHEEEDMWTYLAGDLRVNKPEKYTAPKDGYYGFQECQELIGDRWEGFVTMIKTETGYIKKLEEWESQQ